MILSFIIYVFVMIAFSVGPIDIYWYGIFYLLGFLLGYGFLKLIGRIGLFKNYNRLHDLLYKDTDDILIAIVLGVLLGGRLGEVFIYQWEYFSENLLQIFAIWNGGMSFVGGIIGVGIALLILKKLKKLSWSDFLLLIDCIVSVLPLAILLGRFGNYLNQELYGLVVPDNLWGLGEGIVNILVNINVFHVYDSIDSSLRINTNFLSMLLEGFVLFVITCSAMLYRVRHTINNIKKNFVNISFKIKPGFIIGLFLLFYSLFRFFLEYIRTDSQSQYLGLFTKSQWLFIALAIFGLLFLLRKNVKQSDIH